MKKSIGVLLAILAVTWSASARALEIPGDPSSCGVIVRKGDPGELRGDLDCTGQNVASAITLQSGARLRLNGHRISGGRNQNVACDASSRICTIEGPGEITGSRNGLSLASKAKIRDVVVHGNQVGIYKPYGDVGHAALLDLGNVVIRDNTGDGVRGGAALRFTDVIIENNGGVGTTSYGPSRLKRTSISVNGVAGIVTGRYHDFYQEYLYNNRLLPLVDSSVVGNGLLDGGADLASGKRPKLLRSTCGTSSNPTEPGNPSWGICSGD